MGTLFRFCIGSLKQANNVEYIKTAESLQKNKKLLTDEEGLRDLGQVVVWIYTYTFIKIKIELLAIVLSLESSPILWGSIFVCYEWMISFTSEIYLQPNSQYFLYKTLQTHRQTS